MKNEQESFWSGQFGKGYVSRNSDYDNSIATRCALFSTILNSTIGVNSIIEFGANIGLNLHALKVIRPSASLSAVEINSDTFKILTDSEYISGVNKSILDVTNEDLEVADLTFTSGVLIHIHPDNLPTAYEKLYNFSSKYILVVEYYNPVPVMIPYHGENDKLFKRDFAGDLLDKYKDLELVDYGFKYHRDNNFSEDDLNWFLLKKS